MNWSANVIDDKMHLPFLLDRQTNGFYVITNLTRCAAIFNYIYHGVAKSPSVDNIFKQFLGHPNPQMIPSVFIEKFEEILYLYIRVRFGQHYIIIIEEVQTEGKSFPVTCFIENGFICVLYSRDDISRFINMVTTFHFLYNNDDTFVVNKLVGKTPDGCKGAIGSKTELEQRMTSETLEQIAKTYQDSGRQFEQLKSSFLNQLAIGKLNIYKSDDHLSQIKNPQMSASIPQVMVDSIQTLRDIPIKPQPFNLVNTPVKNEDAENDLQIFSTINECWGDDNKVAMTFLMLITNFLDLCVRPLLSNMISTSLITDNNIVREVDQSLKYIIEVKTTQKSSSQLFRYN